MMKNYYLILIYALVCHRSTLAFSIDLDQIKTHIDRKFAEASLEFDPFPHLVISNILPDDFYAYMLMQWPKEEYFDRNSPLRRRLPVTLGCTDSRFLPSEQKEAWEIFGEVIVNKYIKEPLNALLLPILSYKFSFAPEKLKFIRKNISFINCRSDGLKLDKYGYFINPHVDQAHIFAAILIYFPDDATHPEYGTVLYKSLIGRTSFDVIFPHPSEFKPVKTLPFLPNTLVVFLQTPSGWHGVPALTDPNYIRKAYHAGIQLEPRFTEEVYGSHVYRADDLYQGDLRYLDPQNFRKF